MTPTEIFAAHMWPWPDPLVKRDASGQVLIVNNAFLNLYGGTVHDWHGQMLGGWPAPDASGHPRRFETRQDTDSGEQVLDWIELTLADGSALCIARDVSAYIQSQPQTETFTQEQPVSPPPADISQASPPPVEAQDSSPLDDMLPQLSEPAPDYQHVSSAGPAEHPPAQDEAIPEKPELLDDLLPQMNEQPPQSDPVATAPESPAPRISEPDLPESTRKVDGSALRALPVESPSSALGSNWRDAVIAKATGGEPPAPLPEPCAEDADTDAAATASRPEEEPAPEKIGTGLKILLAEDNAINALLTRTLLEAEGCSVDVVEDGALAVDAVQRSYYDMIFMDMRMPNMDGLEATRAIRTLPDDIKDIIIVALTANAFDDDRRACFESGMNDFMTKPVSADELVAMVKTWMDKREDMAKAS